MRGVGQNKGWGRKFWKRAGRGGQIEEIDYLFRFLPYSHSIYFYKLSSSGICKYLYIFSFIDGENMYLFVQVYMD